MRPYRGMTKEGKWIEGGLYKDTVYSYIIVDITRVANAVRPKVFEVLPESVGQQVGLKDENGKDGYFGDIVEDEGDRYVVAWDDEEGVIYLKSCLLSSIDLEIQAIKKREIIGNITENPELLK